ncbi:MAG: serine/threonine-protein kinase [Pirellulaceae bacterium]
MSDAIPPYQELASQFRQAWHAGERPSLHEFLQRVGPAKERELGRILLPIELECRRRLGETLLAEDYRDYGQFYVQLAKDLLPPDATLVKLDPESDIVISVDTSEKTVDRRSNRIQATETDPARITTTIPKQIGPYKLLQRIGTGGMGEVWMADQETPVRRRVAVKLIKSGVTDLQVIARFEAERQALAMMDDPNIAKVLDAGTTEDGLPYFVMELVRGVPITKYCDKNKLSIDERLQLFVLVCRAVQHAHQKGIIHRDLKPSNVLVCQYDGRPVPKVIDFGLAKALQHTTKLTDKTLFTEFGRVVGTLQYMSPEQAELNQLDIDTRTDIYSLGVMLYELLTGSTPIEREWLGQRALFQVLETIRQQDPPRPSVRLSTVSQDAAAACRLSVVSMLAS